MKKFGANPAFRALVRKFVVSSAFTAARAAGSISLNRARNAALVKLVEV
jgi:hypothetical protein